MVALLPIPIKIRNIPQKWLDDQWQINREVLNEVLRQVLPSVTFNHNRGTESRYYNVLCADGNLTLCKPVLAAWLADSSEYSNLHHLERHVCFWWDFPKHELGHYVPPDKQHPRRDHNLYWMLSDADTNGANAEHSSHNVHREFNLFQHIPCIMSNLLKPDLLHRMHIGMLDPLQKWIFHRMNTHERLDKHNAVWLSVPAYHNHSPKNESYEEVSEWNGKEMKEMSRNLLGGVTQSLRGRSPAQGPIFNHPIACRWALLEFYMYAQYTSHNDATLSYTEDALRHFHTFKVVFLLGRAGKKAKAKANAVRTELMK